MRRQVRQGIGALILCGLLGTSGWVAEAQVVRLQVGQITAASMAPLWAAIETGAFAREGIQILPLTLGSGVTIVQALIAGGLHMTAVGGPSSLTAAVGGAPLTFLSIYVKTLPYILYVSPNIRSPQDLRGGKVGVSTLGGSAHYGAELAVKHVGLNPERDVTYLPVGGNRDRFAALTSGSIQGTILQPPYTLFAKQRGLRPLVDIAALDLKYPQTGVVVSRAYRDANQAVLRRFFRAFVSGIATAKTDRATTIAVLAKYLKSTDQAVLEETYTYWAKVFAAKPYPDTEEIQTFLNDFAKRDPRAKAVRVEDVADRQFITELDQSGFIDRLYR